jgi:hypothetical protein
MKMVLLTLDQKWDEENEIEIVRCPICDHQWYSDGEYGECQHLIFVVCTYDSAEFLYVSEFYKDSSFITALKETFDEYYGQLDDMDSDTEITIEDIIFKKLQDMNSSEVTHCLVDESVPDPPEMTYFVTIYGYKE